MKLKRILSAVLSAVILSCGSASVYAASDVFGDANGDNILNVRDAAYIAKNLASNIALGTGADYNSDGAVNVRDAANIAKILSLKTEATQMLQLVNALRAEVGAAPLKLNDDLLFLADKRAAEITEVFSHTRPDGTMCYSIASEYGRNGFYGENIAYGFSSIAGVVSAWKNSPGHYANMTGSGYTYLGMGHNGSHWVQIFS